MPRQSWLLDEITKLPLQRQWTPGKKENIRFHVRFKLQTFTSSPRFGFVPAKANGIRSEYDLSHIPDSVCSD